MKRAEGQLEHSLCGLSFDAFESVGVDAQVVFATAGETVTCPDCRRHIDYVRSAFPRGYRYVPS